MYIILHGGPADGKTFNVPENTYEWRVPVPPEPDWNYHVDPSRPELTKIACYRRTNMKRGMLDGTYPVVFAYTGN